MRLVLSVVGDNAGPLGRDAQKAFGVDGGTLGRSNSCTWRLPDPTNTLSARHAVIAHNGIGFTITDTSTNGVYINTVDAALGRGNTAPMADGDTLYLAGYVISVVIESDPADDRQKLGLSGTAAARLGGDSRFGGQSPGGSIGVGGALGTEPVLPVDPLAAIGGLPPAPTHFPRPAAVLPPARDPLSALDDMIVQSRASEPNDLLSGRPSPSTPSLPFSPSSPSSPRAVGPALPAYSGPPPGLAAAHGQAPPSAVPPVKPGPAPSAIIPVEFDFSDLVPGARAGIGATPQPPNPTAPPNAAQPRRPPLGLALANDFVALRDPAGAPPLPGERVLDPVALLRQRATDRAPRRESSTSPVLAEASPFPSPAGGDEDSRALWNALGIDPQSIPPERRQEALSEIGTALREMAEGLHAVLAARTMVKSELQIEQTRIQSGDNNPFKFFKSGQDALRRALTKEPGYLSLPQSVRAGFQDIRAHEFAAMVAMRNVIGNVLIKVSPPAIETEGMSSGVFKRNDKGKLWDRFVELHGSMVNDIDKTIRSLVTEEFSRSYDRHVAELRQDEGMPT